MNPIRIFKILLVSACIGLYSTAASAIEPLKSIEELTKMLKLSGTDREIAIAHLQEYGDLLLGTEAFRELYQIASAPASFPTYDAELSRLEKGPVEKLTKIPDDEMERYRLKFNSLLAIAMTGDPTAVNLVHQLARSKSKTEQSIAQEIQEKIDRDGIWKMHRTPTKSQDNRYYFSGKEFSSKADYLAAVMRALQAGSDGKRIGILQTLAATDPRTLANSQAIDLLAAMFEEARGRAKPGSEAQKMREVILEVLYKTLDPRVEAILQKAMKDPDRQISSVAKGCWDQYQNIQYMMQHPQGPPR